MGGGRGRGRGLVIIFVNHGLTFSVIIGCCFVFRKHAGLGISMLVFTVHCCGLRPTCTI